MSYILVPHQNFCAQINFSCDEQLSQYELRKAFSTDTKEYALIPSTSRIYFSYPQINPGTQALVLWTENYTATPVVQSSTEEDFETIINMNAGGIYGLNKKLIIYSNQGSNYYRINPTGVDLRLKNLSFGRLYSLPSDFRLEIQSTTHKYELSKVYFNLLGQTKYDGFANQGLRKSYTLEFNFITEAEKQNLIQVFTLGKGCLPMWLIEDLNNSESWIFGIFRGLTYMEPYAGYFNVSISIQEL
ncbi:MAG: hypothetical protein KatS3mg036_0505 [Ignavibacterium sp.]|uniref:hypothetical protein n=1 Tax=Ignavibacterium sp. TaxID=2651167 RepID=UPI0021DE45AB|nr:hypothetical protein [Ignavibacterium sp.]BDQ01951.1 MAG: hypothetical protein KatS3mg037_0526 [Ignavibacterium sp.]GIV45687.1 MAG: hypothetical protein KatS3mg036_0505 [Ignavibacterium sp.]